MKNLSSFFMLVMMIVAAIGLSACGGDDDDGGGNGGDNGSRQTLTIDGKSYYYGSCSAQQTRSSGMYLNVWAVENQKVQVSGHELVAHISPNFVADLKVGDKFEEDNMSIQTFRRLTEIPLNSYRWKIIDGNITITKITDMEMTIQINNLQLKHKDTGVEHTISGVAVLNSGTYSSDTKLLSFEDAIN